ncbi:VanZ family protein [Treponema sp.]|uniref:VanZ family protein n=1 Tax=Treponema sp. TaxID=166 RepID=UPI0039A2E776
MEHMPAFWNADKIVHFVCFGGLCFWMTFACRTRRISRIWIPVLIVSIYGIIDEIHQSFVPGRSCSIYDWIADTGGAVSGALTFIAFLRIVQNKIKKKY